MYLHDYQEEASATAIYPDAGRGTASARGYVALGLTGEAGEVANKVKKILRDGVTSPEGDVAIAAELGDVLWYVAQMATELGLDLEMIARANLAKLQSRAERGTLRGSGDDR